MQGKTTKAQVDAKHKSLLKTKQVNEKGIKQSKLQGITEIRTYFERKTKQYE